MTVSEQLYNLCGISVGINNKLKINKYNNISIHFNNKTNRATQVTPDKGNM